MNSTPTSSKAIGIFDSGVGGLSVFREVRKLLPNEDIVYLGDTARVPYGTKSQETVLKYTIQNSLFLLDQGVKAIVIACNTASAYGLDSLKGYYKVPVLGVVEPGARSVVAHTKNKKVGVIGTEGTIRSGAYTKAIHTIDSSIEVFSNACPLLVPLAEEGWFKGEVVEKILQTYLQSFKEKELDSLILGCTHYPLFKEAIASVLGPSVSLIDSAVETAQVLKSILDVTGLVTEKKTPGSDLFYATDAAERMKRVGEMFLGRPMAEVLKVEV